MHNLVKLVQASGKALVLPADAVAGGILRTLEPHERKANPEAKTFAWLIMSGQAQTALLRESLGFILNKAGGNSGDRVVLRGLGGTKVSMQRGAFVHAIEGERVLREDDKPDGKEISREDGTILQTNLHGPAGAVAFFVAESAAELFDIFSADVSDDDGSVEYDDDGNVIVADEPATAGKKRAKA
ncbi:hypothetical protein AX777_18210 [Sphingobium yanoikuyae]|uniref:Uncharacterized protein n=1 Tax=Sphingobium yanoikuyae TaxID=13690 RepID=A0A177J760_SPHYA|nr:hypothetical protein [Sphingobium yanoikuyae]OAH36973.1 hypothetical protein AX777_18210 [Sphingobium yanoikuyae]